MRETRQNGWLIAVSVLAVVALGFFREFLFIHINEQLFALWYDEPSQATDSLPLLKTLDYQSLYYSKWLLTVLFAGLFWASIGGVLKVIFGKAYFKELTVVYAVLFAGAGLSLGIGYISDSLEESYIIARFLMGIAQSPLLLMVMIPGVMLRAGGVRS